MVWLFIVIQAICDKAGAFCEWVWAVCLGGPNPAFLSDIAAFAAVVVALAVPFSYDIIARISDRYQSDVIINEYRRHRVVRWMPGLALLTVLLAVTFRIAIKEGPDSVPWNICALALWLWFVFFSLALARFLWLTTKYGSDVSYVMERLFRDAEKALQIPRD
jgi:hypothetical protein